MTGLLLSVDTNSFPVVVNIVVLKQLRGEESPDDLFLIKITVNSERFTRGLIDGYVNWLAPPARFD